MAMLQIMRGGAWTKRPMCGVGQRPLDDDNDNRIRPFNQTDRDSRYEFRQLLTSRAR